MAWEGLGKTHSRMGKKGGRGGEENRGDVIEKDKGEEEEEEEERGKRCEENSEGSRKMRN